MARLLVIGAGWAQVEAIRRAQGLGHTVIAADGDPRAPGLAVADEARVLDITDGQAVLVAARESRIDGVVSFSVEAAVRSLATVAEGLGLPGPSLEAARNATSKQRMRRAWAEKGVPSCQSLVCRTLAEAQDAATRLFFPVVVKPDDNAGSRGVRLVTDSVGLVDAYAAARSFSHNGDVLVEAFMPGEEMSVEGFVHGETFHLTGTSDKIRSQPPPLLDLAVFFPSTRADTLHEAAIRVVRDAALALGLDMCPVHAEVMVTSDGPRMVELAARGPGFKVFSLMIPWSGGIDVIGESIRVALGERPTFQMLPTPRGAVLLFPQAPPGRVVSVEGFQDARAVPHVCDLDIYVKPGDAVQPLRAGSDRIGHVIALANDRETAERAARAAETLIRVRTA